MFNVSAMVPHRSLVRWLLSSIMPASVQRPAIPRLTRCSATTMSFPTNVKIVEVAPVYLAPPCRQARAANGLTDELLDRLTRAGVMFIAAGTQLQGANFGLPLSVQQPERDRVHGQAIPTCIIGEYALYGGAPDAASSYGLSALTFDVTASDGFARAAYGASAADQLTLCLDLITGALDCGIVARARINMAYGCPYEGAVDGDVVATLAATLYTHGCTEVVLADTLGVATPQQAAALVRKLAKRIPKKNIGVRFHDTYGLALTNIYCCLAAGIACIESSLGGVYAQAQGNYLETPVATEDVVNMLHGLNIGTGMDLQALVAASHFIARGRRCASISKTASAFQAAGCRI